MCSIRINVIFLLIFLLTLSVPPLVDSLSSNQMDEVWRNTAIKRTTSLMKDTHIHTILTSDDEENDFDFRSSALNEGKTMRSSRNSKGLLIGFLTSTFNIISKIN